VSRELEYAGTLHRINYQVMLERLAGSAPVGPVKVLADVVEAGSLGVRARDHKYTTDEPLNRLPDTVLPESDVARHFTTLVASAKDPAGSAQIRHWLITWRDNDARLQPIIVQSALLKGSAPASQMLTEVAKIGLEALDAIDAGKHLDQAWAMRTKTRLTAAARPVSEVRIGIVAAVQALADQAH